MQIIQIPPGKDAQIHRPRSHKKTHLSNVTDHADHTDHAGPVCHANPPINMDHANPPINIYMQIIVKIDPIMVKINTSYRSHILHSGRSYRSCISNICTDHTDQVPLR